ncbi:hypothetical protein SUGI_1342730 [Cryptomeria japonica]|uniref:Uncharacterized protein n=1 Tax=Cryptomeria japonica TaxID=3369 RepID=A0AAD3NRH6_CRYJA|nr:hypothetical protein SUGI_1342730 [Cryptomeria japonica]
MASLPSTTLRQSSSLQKKNFSCHRRSIGLKRGFFAAASNPRTIFPCLKASYLLLPANRLRICHNRLAFLASSPDTPKREINPNPSYPTPSEPDVPKPEINPNPSYPTPGEPATTPGKHPQHPFSLLRRLQGYTMSEEI